jgi:hypothetical protein
MLYHPFGPEPPGLFFRHAGHQPVGVQKNSPTYFELIGIGDRPDKQPFAESHPKLAFNQILGHCLREPQTDFASFPNDCEYAFIKKAILDLASIRRFYPESYSGKTRDASPPGGDTGKLTCPIKKFTAVSRRPGRRNTG